MRYTPIDDIDLIGSWTNLDATEPAGIEARRPEDQGALDATMAHQWRTESLNLGRHLQGGDQTDTISAPSSGRAGSVHAGAARASYELSDGVEIYARVENLTDERYEEVIGSSIACVRRSWGCGSKAEQRSETGPLDGIAARLTQALLLWAVFVAAAVAQYTHFGLRSGQLRNASSR